MTLQELSKEYQQHAQTLKYRMDELQLQYQKTSNPSLRQQLSDRIQLLSQMYYETQALASLTKHYYDQHFRKNPDYML